jgi:hypothetical protein
MPRWGGSDSLLNPSAEGRLKCQRTGSGPGMERNPASARLVAGLSKCASPALWRSAMARSTAFTTAIFWDIAPPYYRNWNLSKLLCTARRVEARAVVLTTTHQQHFDRLAGQEVGAPSETRLSHFPRFHRVRVARYGAVTTIRQEQCQHFNGVIACIENSDGVDRGGGDEPDAAVSEQPGWGQMWGQTSVRRGCRRRFLTISLRNLVSRDGIEPSTRRLRVCCSAN